MTTATAKKIPLVIKIDSDKRYCGDGCMFIEPGGVYRGSGMCLLFKERITLWKDSWERCGSCDSAFR